MFGQILFLLDIYKYMWPTNDGSFHYFSWSTCSTRLIIIFFEVFAMGVVIFILRNKMVSKTFNIELSFMLVVELLRYLTTNSLLNKKKSTPWQSFCLRNVFYQHRDCSNCADCSIIFAGFWNKLLNVINSFCLSFASFDFFCLNNILQLPTKIWQTI